MIQIRRYLQFLQEHNITQSQYLFLMIVHNQNQLFDLLPMYKQMYFDNQALPKSLLTELIEKKLITCDKVNSDNLKLSEFKTTPVVEKILIDWYKASSEFYDLYPCLVRNERGQTFPLTIMDNNEFRTLYGEIVHYSQQEHEEMLEDLKYGIENNLINMKLENYLKSQFYLQLRKMRTTKTESVVNVQNYKHDF